MATILAFVVADAYDAVTLASTEIDNAAHITFRMQNTVTLEGFQFGFSTGVREEGAILGLLEAMETWWDDDGSSQVAQSTCTEIVYAEWGNVPFTGFHQIQSLLTNITSGTGNICPPQCAGVLSILNVDNAAQSIKRRRGRMYFGSVPVSHLDSAGKFTSGTRTLYLANAATLQLALNIHEAVEVEFSGLGIASAAAGSLFNAQKVGFGLGVDTQRRRREKVNEAITYEDL